MVNSFVYLHSIFVNPFFPNTHSRELLGYHPNQIRKWRKQLLECLPDLFTDRRKRKDKEQEKLIEELYRQIDKLKVELDWPKNQGQELTSHFSKINVCSRQDFHDKKI